MIFGRGPVKRWHGARSAAERQEDDGGILPVLGARPPIDRVASRWDHRQARTGRPRPRAQSRTLRRLCDDPAKTGANVLRTGRSPSGRATRKVLMGGSISRRSRSILIHLYCATMLLGRGPCAAMRCHGGARSASGRRMRKDEAARFQPRGWFKHVGIERNPCETSAVKRAQHF